MEHQRKQRCVESAESSVERCDYADPDRVDQKTEGDRADREAGAHPQANAAEGGALILSKSCQRHCIGNRDDRRTDSLSSARVPLPADHRFEQPEPPR